MMIETIQSIPATDDKRIYYILNRSGEKADKAIILAHGLTGSATEHIHQAATQVFLAQGYDVYRISFYFMQSDARKLPDCTLRLHADDINRLVAHISKDYAKVFAAGHSYGGLSVLLANPPLTSGVAGFAFWDSSYVPDFWSEAIYIPETDNYKIGWGVYCEIGKAMVEEARTYTREHARELAQKVKTPSLVVLATKGQENADATALYDDLDCVKALVQIDASHIFWETGTAEQLAHATDAFFSKL